MQPPRGVLRASPAALSRRTRSSTVRSPARTSGQLAQQRALRARPWLLPRLYSSAPSASASPTTGPSSSNDAAPLSISIGPTDSPRLLSHTIPEQFAEIVSRYPDQPAVVARAPLVAAGVTDIAPARETVYTFSELDRVSDHLAHGLASSAKVKKGDRVAVSLGNGPEFAALTYALFKLGAVLVPLNPAFTAKQVASALCHLGVEVLIMGAVTDLPYKPGRGRSNLGLLSALVGGDEALAAQRAGAIQSPEVPTLRTVVVVDNTADHPAVAGAGDFARPEERLAALTPFSAITDGVDILRADQVAALQKKPVVPDAPLQASDTINIQFTSGTTSQPKAAQLSHTAILNNGYFIGQRMELTTDDRIVCPPPLFHCFGSVLGYMATATSGAAILFPSPAFDPAASLQMAADHRATGLYGVATMFVAMLELLEHKHEHGAADAAARKPLLSRARAAALPTHLRTGIAAGSSVPESLMRRLFDTLGLHDLVICYGMTETAPVSCMTTRHDPLAMRTSTVGRVMPHTTVKIVDPEDWTRIVPRGQPGELATSGYLVMAGYYGDAEKTSEVLTVDPVTGERWMHSGDEACMDADGYVSVTGRIKDLIIRGGENIHPLEIENCLFQHPLVAEVSVVGVPDPRHGESVGAFVVPHGGVRVAGGYVVESEPSVIQRADADDSDPNETLSPDSIRAWVRDRLSPHLSPKHVFWTTSFPKTASGKIQKFKLRDVAKELLAAGAKGSDKT
ncbi:hypothetical protein HMPREF1624_03358 [Sporothrix schenckii ATCC 58251]|uniref:AMP-dependent synthetase/ligase domain-containing protein n=1 Tax=Sporothrix schenckii (strain ATCC 58251 / de Perez 2211183) TaxID=1391915 RepID=U7PWH4_SPOS1|nr:hypothetical protein HMPREF1624_03358 [Sporothrix schenckii ATCC 58251]